MRYVYCPLCGNRLAARKAGDDGDVPYCDSCGKYWFDTFSSVAIVMVVNEKNEIALLRQNYLSEVYRTFVSGFMKPGESAEETAEREVAEELGLDIERLEYAGTYWFGAREQLMHGFIGYVRGREFVLSEEVDAAEWVPYAEAPARMFPDRPGNSQHPIYRLYVEKLKNRQA